MATGVNFMIFEKRSHVTIVYITLKKIKFNSKINKRSYRLRFFLLKLSNRLLELEFNTFICFRDTKLT
jgi:hypothetical protein